MKSKENSEDKKRVKRVKDEIEEKIDRLQKQNEAESVALRKILDGLNKIEEEKSGSSSKKKK